LVRGKRAKQVSNSVKKGKHSLPQRIVASGNEGVKKDERVIRQNARRGTGKGGKEVRIPFSYLRCGVDSSGGVEEMKDHRGVVPSVHVQGYDIGDGVLGGG